MVPRSETKCGFCRSATVIGCSIEESEQDGSARGGREAEVYYNALMSTENGSFDEAYAGNFCVWESLARSTKPN